MEQGEEGSTHIAKEIPEVKTWNSEFTDGGSWNVWNRVPVRGNRMEKELQKSEKGVPTVCTRVLH